MERFIVSARKYRPNSFENLIGQENIARTLKNSITRKQLAHAYLFCGPRGVGKTTSARIFAKTINCLNPSDNMDPCGVCESCVSFAEGRSYSIHELDAASNNSVDDIRQLNDLVRIPPQIGKYSVYIIDEVHMLSQAAFNAFLKTLEEPPAHAIFILATTEKHKILPTILSRCQTYDFNRISVEDIVRNLKDIALKEGVTIDIEALHIIAQKADGAMRDALTLFDQTVAFCGQDVSYGQVISTLNVLDYEYYIRLTNHFLNSSHAEVMLIFDEILSKGFNALHFIAGLSSHFRDLLICKDRSTQQLLDLAPSVAEKYREQSERCSLNFLYDALSITTACEAGYKLSGNQRLHIEFALFRLCRITSPDWISGEVKRGLVKSEGVKSVEVKSDGVKSEQPVKSEEVKSVEVKSEEVKSEEQVNSAGIEIKPKAEPQTKSMTTSIKDLMKSAEQTISIQEEIRTQERGEDDFDMEKLLPVWERMAESEKSLPNLANALRQCSPVISEKTKIHFMVGNQAQKEWIERKCILRLNEFLQKHLNNKNIELSISVTPDDKREKKLYLPEEKANFLLGSNPELKELQNDLKLEIK
ncbi:MAG: DNA polymerase III subunit gamma/tau [Bacteroidales bacterium]|nr:DNA polymerase III subunit gamma/tau [Bacteroidales bacterium]